MKAYLIARVSTDEQADALPGQVYRLTDYASRKGYSYELFEIKESAYKSERTSFKRVIGKLSNNDEACVVVFDKIDRYTRNSNSEEVSLLNAMCRVGQIELHFPSDNLYITKNSSAQEHFMLNMGVSTAQYYSDSIRDNVKRRIEQKLREGECIGRVPIGYKNFRHENGKADVKVVPYHAQAIVEAFKLYASGNVSLGEIRAIWRDKYGLQKGINVIAKLLHNQFYCGFIEHNGETYPHKYEKLVSIELFNKVQDQFEQFSTRKKRWAGIAFHYRGLITCADCGSRITFERHKGKYVYAKCASGRGVHELTYVPESTLTKQFMNIIQAIKIPHEAYLQVSEAIKNEHADKQKQIENERHAIDTELAKYKTRRETMYIDRLDGVISEDFYKENMKKFTELERILLERKENIELNMEDRLSNNLYLLQLAKDAPKLFEKANQMQKRKMLNLILSNSQLFGSKLRWEYKKPFDTMAFCAKTESWCG